MGTATKAKTKARNGRPKVSREERAARVAALCERLDAYADSLDPDEQETFEARFDHYSPRNALLIVMQRPDATVVHGLRDWHHHGRAVKPGEHGIQILAPAGAFTVEDRDAPAGPDGKPGEKTIHRYRIATVFDYAQTEPLEVAQARWEARRHAAAAAADTIDDEWEL